MEKIYMEEEKQNNKKIMNLSTVLSFVVAFFAVFSLAMFGIVGRQGSTIVSYAAPDDAPAAAASFTLKNAEKDGKVLYVRLSSASATPTTIPIYLDGDGNPVFCAEVVKDPHIDAAYNYEGVIDDYGLLYILNQHGKPEISGTYADYFKMAVTQMAAWIYLQEENPTNTTEYAIPADRLTTMKTATTAELYETGESTPLQTVNGNIYETYVKDLVSAARSKKDGFSLTVSAEEGDPSRVGDYYQSTVVTVVGSPSGDLASYDISLSGIEGAFLVDEEGNRMESTLGIAADKKFYVRIPADKVTETAQNLQISATGHFNSLEGYYYESGTYQRAVKISGNNVSSDASTSITFVGAPDTAMNKAQTIYFIGLIILLCGVGIVYANAKPVESKQ